MCKSVFFISFQSLKTVGKFLEVLEKSLNFTQTCLYEPCHDMCLVGSERTEPVSVILIVGISGSRFATFSTVVCQMLSATLIFFYKMSVVFFLLRCFQNHFVDLATF